MRRIKKVFADEFGDCGSVPNKDYSGYYAPSRIFGYAFVIVEDEQNYAKVMVSLLTSARMQTIKPYVPGKEIKARRLPSDLKIEGCKKISKTARSFSFSVDKLGELPRGWYESTGSERMVGLLLFSLSKLISKISERNLEFVVDEHESYSVPELSCSIEKVVSYFERRYKKRITLCFESSSHGVHKEYLQTTDIVANAALEHLERSNPDYYENAKAEDYRLKSTDSIVISEIMKM